MGMFKKLARSLSGKESGKKKSGKIRSSQDYVSQGSNPRLHNQHNSAAGTSNGLPPRVEVPAQRPDPDVQLQFVRRPSEAAVPQSTPFATSRDEPNIQEVSHKSARQSAEGPKPASVFVRPQLDQHKFTTNADANTHANASTNANTTQQPSTSASQAKEGGKPAYTVALTIIIDSSLSASKTIRDIAVGILNLLRVLSAEDSISIYGCDENSSGLFTFQADMANYPQIMDLICNLKAQSVGRQPKLNDAIVMVVEELGDLDPTWLKPLVIMSDYQEQADMGPPFEAQHALLWSTARNLHPIFVSVWDQDLFSEVRTRTSKEVHIETLTPSEISAAILVVQAHLKAVSLQTMIKQHQDQIDQQKSQHLLKTANEIQSSSPSPSSRDDWYQERPSAVSIPTLPQSLPPVSEPSLASADTHIDHEELNGDFASPDSGKVHPLHTTAPSIASEVGLRESLLDSIENRASSSGGHGEREGLRMADFPEVPSEEKYLEDPEWEKTPAEPSSSHKPQELSEFEGFQSSGNALFLDGAGSDDGYEEYSMDVLLRSKMQIGETELPPLQGMKTA